MAATMVDAETGEIERLPNQPDFGALEPERLRPFLIDRQGTTVVLYAGLVAALHAESRGYFALETRIEQLPSAANGQTAVVSARVRILDRSQPDVVLREASGIGDADEGNVSKMMAGAVIRMAETRAKGRALRDLLNVRQVVAEELSDAAPERPQTRQDARGRDFGPPVVRPPAAGAGAAPRPVAAQETIQVGGRTLSRGQVLDVYHARLTAAEQAGLQLAPMGQPGGPPSSDAPLPAIVDYCKEITRRLDARSGAVHANGAGGK
jgi:hypothetical protein